jgi:L-alanine-DL-glutamate epimerase-like enolase superfamily enzyme
MAAYHRLRTIVTAPGGTPLIVDRVDTSVAGLYGLGCATFTQPGIRWSRSSSSTWHPVVAFVEQHLERLVVGRYPGDIADLVRLMRFSGYWREGPVENNALSGLDMALWDIAGKRACMPVYELLGGKACAAADTYIHAGGARSSRPWNTHASTSTPGGGISGSSPDSAASEPAVLRCPDYRSAPVPPVRAGGAWRSTSPRRRACSSGHARTSVRRSRCCTT